MKITLIGFGSVGQSFIQLLQSQAYNITHNHGIYPKIVAIVDRGGAVTDPIQINYHRALEAKLKYGSVSFIEKGGIKGSQAKEIIEESDADVVIEASSTNFQDGEPALTHIKTALKNKIHVITTNKGPLAVAMPALMELAQYNNVKLGFSGTVGGGTPFLSFAKKCLVGNPIRSIRGVLNGTTNYILTRMFDEEMPLEAALAEAQKLGYAETDPSNDLEGVDTACKLVILANYIIGRRVSLKDVQITGITDVTLKKMCEAKKDGQIIKLIGSIGENLNVQPAAIPKSHPLNVSGALNSVLFDTTNSGEITIVGKGAGGVETASAILRDLIDIKKESLL